MPSKPPSRPLRLPPEDLAQQALPRTHLPARAWHRIHPTDRGAIHFSLNASHRFSHPNCPGKILYLGADPETCLWERFGDTVFDQDHRISKSLWMNMSVSFVRVPASSICDLGRTAVRNALNVDIASLMSCDLSVTQAWGLAIHEHPAHFCGIKFNSRFSNRPCLALFDRNGIRGGLKEDLLGPLADFDPALYWLEKLQVQLV